MSMTEAKLILPVTDNDGLSTRDAMDVAVNAILKAFGGFTMQEANGAWRDEKTGRVYWDATCIYTIAANWTARQCDIIRDIAADAAIGMGQECIYLALPHGVEFIEPAHVEAIAA